MNSKNTFIHIEFEESNISNSQKMFFFSTDNQIILTLWLFSLFFLHFIFAFSKDPLENEKKNYFNKNNTKELFLSIFPISDLFRSIKIEVQNSPLNINGTILLLNKNFIIEEININDFYPLNSNIIYDGLIENYNLINLSLNIENLLNFNEIIFNLKYLNPNLQNILERFKILILIFFSFVLIKIFKINENHFIQNDKNELYILGFITIISLNPTFFIF